MTFVSRKRLSRRALLKGAGAAIALPMLDAMTPALAAGAQARTPVRLAFVYVPNGIIMPDWTPSAPGRDFAFTRILKPLEPFRQDLFVLTGLCDHNGNELGDGPAVDLHHLLEPVDDRLRGVDGRRTAHRGQQQCFDDPVVQPEGLAEGGGLRGGERVLPEQGGGRPLGGHADRGAEIGPAQPGSPLGGEDDVGGLRTAQGGGHGH